MTAEQIHRGDAESTEPDAESKEFVDDPITKAIIGSAIAVHRALGPGLLESAYQACLFHELNKRGFVCEREVLLPVIYDGVRIDCAYRIDLLVGGEVIVETKCVEEVSDLHLAQLLTYLQLSGKARGLLLNFHEVLLKNGIYRRVLTRPRPSSASAATASLR